MILVNIPSGSFRCQTLLAGKSITLNGHGKTMEAYSWEKKRTKWDCFHCGNLFSFSFTNDFHLGIVNIWNMDSWIEHLKANSKQRQWNTMG